MSFKGHTACPCGKSSDGLAIYDDGWSHCFVCDKNIPTGELPEKDTKVDEPLDHKPITPLFENSRPYGKRGLLEETIKRYKVGIPLKAPYEACYPLFDLEGNHVSNKFRHPKEGTKKVFHIEGDFRSVGLFGRQAFPPGSAKSITVTEGYDDAMAAYQMFGSRYPAVSVHSASSAVNDIKRDFEYLNSFPTIVIAFDSDEPGQKAARAVAAMGFPIGKIKLLCLRKHKDANDYLLAREAEGFTKEWWQAPVYRPDGLKLGQDIWKDIIERKESFAVPYPFPRLNTLTFGVRLSELVIITADTGVGKTTFLKEIEHHLLTHPEVVEKEYGVGFLHLEEPNGDTALGLLSIHNSVPYHIPGIDRPEAELRKAYDEVLNNSRVVVWDHFGSNTVDAVVDKVRHMAALGCKYIVLDHLSIVVSDQSGDERKQLDEIATKLKTVTMELDISVLAVIHTNRQGQIRGTAGVEQLANMVIRLERKKTDSNAFTRNVTKVTVEKNRFSGYTGPGTYLHYNPDTGRMVELDDEEIARYEGEEFVGF